MRLPPLELWSGDREELESRVRSNTVEARDAERARLVLMAADGASNRDIGTAIISASQVWRICRSLDLKPWQSESWMTSHDPAF